MRILVVVGDQQLARTLDRALGQAGFTVDGCASGAEAVARAGRGTECGLVLLDRKLPDVDALDVCRQIRRSGSTIPILMLMACSQASERVLGLDAGADDCLAKPFELEELLARVHALIRRSSGHAQLTIGPLVIDRIARRALLEGKPLDLTSRELTLLMHLAQHGDHIVTKSELLNHVWSIQIDPESNVVEVHVSRLRDKLGAYEWMIETVRGRGYRFRTTPPTQHASPR